jgi:hypothetical protein
VRGSWGTRGVRSSTAAALTGAPISSLEHRLPYTQNFSARDGLSHDGRDFRLCTSNLTASWCLSSLVASFMIRSYETSQVQQHSDSFGVRILDGLAFPLLRQRTCTYGNSGAAVVSDSPGQEYRCLRWHTSSHLCTVSILGHVFTLQITCLPLSTVHASRRILSFHSLRKLHLGQIEMRTCHVKPGEAIMVCHHSHIPLYCTPCNTM